MFSFRLADGRDCGAHAQASMLLRAVISLIARTICIERVIHVYKNGLYFVVKKLK